MGTNLTNWIQISTASTKYILIYLLTSCTNYFTKLIHMIIGTYPMKFSIYILYLQLKQFF